MARILILEDSEFELRRMEEILLTTGHELEPLQTLDEARTYLSMSRYDLVIADLLLGKNESGLSLLRTIRRDLELLTPIIVCSAYLSTELEGVTKLFQNVHILVKPYAADSLLSLVEQLLKPGADEETP